MHNAGKDGGVRLARRIAPRDDIPAVMALIEAAIAGDMAAFLSPREVEAARATLGIDTRLIDDGRRFLIESPSAEGVRTVIVKMRKSFR